jgi:integrase/recombinase XerC
VGFSRGWNAALRGFSIWQRAADRSPGTIRLYAYRLTDLAQLAPSPAAVTLDLLLAELVGHPWSPETRKSVRSAWSSFFRWALGAGVVDTDPTALLPPISVRPGVPRPAPEHVVRGALAASDLRLVFMVLLAAHGGLRAHEIARVHRRDLAGDVLHVLGKGRKERIVPVSGDLLGRLEQLDGYAFPNLQHGGHITAGHVSRLLSRGLPDGWTAHTLRHRMATTAYAGTGDLLAVQKLLGHSRPETTQRYVALDDDRLRAAARAATAA